ncbi:hypothetical protein FHR83_005453 [Actinoplanes campanulatus]|uniref:Uncharacterized protein n=1 Tax=Actinoplanes campanulatus TaxID=113559 RepID=A0A7W5AL50_9ACTN|nr:hypothetical protein [Actinoplanes campanulatus]
MRLLILVAAVKAMVLPRQPPKVEIHENSLLQLPGG